MKSTLPAEEIVQLIDAHFAALVLFARQWIPDGTEDVVQESLVKLVELSRTKEKPDNPVAWLYKVVRNRAISQFRKISNRLKYEQKAAGEKSVWFISASVNGYDSEEIADMLKRLPVEQREIVIQRIWGGLSFDEIADTTNASRTTVFRRYTEAIETLRKFF